MHARHLSLILFATLLCACATTEPGKAQSGGAGGSAGSGGSGGTGGAGGMVEAPALTEAQTAHLATMVRDFATSQAWPNLAIGVVKGADLVWQTGFAATGTPPDADTIFRAGSVTKLVTATALLDLAEEGVLSLDDDAARWLPEAEDTLSPAGRPAITLRHLISHASGLPSLGNGTLAWGSSTADITEADVLRALEGVELAFDPGTSHAYSNIGAALAGVVVARASEQSYRADVQQRVLDPLGMDSSIWDAPTSGLAPGHHASPQGGYQRAPSTWKLGAMEPAGGLFTTVADLARFASFGLGHAAILDAETLAESQTEVRDLPGATGYGLGWIVTETPPLGKVAWHNGSTSDYGAYLAVAGAHDIGVVALAGTGNLGDVAEIESLGIAALAYLVDPETTVVPRASVTPADAVETVGARLLGLTSAPDAALVEEAIAPSFFLLAMSQAQTLAWFEGVARDVGGCSAYELVEDRGQGSFLLRLDCTHAALMADVSAETAAPWRMSGFLLQPAR